MGLLSKPGLSLPACIRPEASVRDLMCRLLCVRSAASVSMRHHLERFAETARNSPEDQSHGWGCAWLTSDGWQFYHSIRPIWEDCYERFSPSNFFLAHARSAYRNEGIEVSNNMPFDDGGRVFIFNGELQGVRVREEGRIGAEKVFNFILRFDRGDMETAIRQGVNVLTRKTRYIRAMNLIIATDQSAWLSTQFNENPDYFQMHEKHTDNMVIVSSSPYQASNGWTRIENHTVMQISKAG